MASNVQDVPENDVTDDNVEPPPNQAKKRKGPGSTVKGKKYSWVWKHFTPQEQDEDKANCNHCGKEMIVPSGQGTSNMKKHLVKTCTTYQLWEAANKNGNQTVLNSNGSTAGKVSGTVIRDATNEMIVIGQLPLSFVESLAWRYFCAKAQLPKPHSRRTATRDIVKIHATKKEEMMTILGQNKQRISLTTDIWVDPFTRASYMVITAHFVDDWWVLRKFIIAFKTVYDHKGATICKVLRDCLRHWNIKRVFTITVDNATANSSAMREFKEEFEENGPDAFVLGGEYLHVRCAAHIINLIVKEGLQGIGAGVDAIRNAIHFVRSSTPRLKSFEDRVESGRVQRGSLPLDVKTRWNSTFLMLEQAQKFKDGFGKMLEEDKVYNDYFSESVEGDKKRIGPPKKEDWESIDRLIQFLKIFYKSTLVISASTSVASHKLYNEIVSMTKIIRELSTSPGPDGDLRTDASSMLAKLDKYWDPFGVEVEMNRLLIVASVFDPRKKMNYAQMCFATLYGKNSAKAIHLCESVNDILKKLFEEYSNIVESATVSQSQTQAGSSSQSQSQDQFVDQVADTTMLGNGVRYESMDDLYKEFMQESGFQQTSNELDLYLKESVECPNIPDGLEYDVLAFWKNNSGKYPILSLVAKDILAMQVSSVASESAFSTSGRLLNSSRSSLTPYMVEVLVCLEQWLKSEIKMNEKGLIRKEQMLADFELQDELMREYEPAFQPLHPQ